MPPRFLVVCCFFLEPLPFFMGMTPSVVRCRCFSISSSDLMVSFKRYKTIITTHAIASPAMPPSAQFLVKLGLTGASGSHSLFDNTRPLRTGDIRCICCNRRNFIGKQLCCGRIRIFHSNCQNTGIRRI